MENIKAKFDFDDILIIPSITTRISSRYQDIRLPENLPLFTAPMDTVVDLKNMKLFLDNGINVALPRTIPYEDFFTYSRSKSGKNDEFKNVFISMGFADLDKHLKNVLKYVDSESNIIIDVANGHMEKILNYARLIKTAKPDITLMIGNIANPATYSWYAESGYVDYIRVGIGNGNGCLTTKQSGIGHPMASLIYETYLNKCEWLKNHPNTTAPAIVADGGMKDYSDIIKSLALGADYVMIGSLFNKAFESSAKNYLYRVKLNKKIAQYFFDRGYPVKKFFRGMSTKEAQKAMGKTNFKTSEGVIRFRRVEYHLDGWIENFEHYLRNMMSYVNAKTLEEFIGKVEICQISKNAYDRFNK